MGSVLGTLFGLAIIAAAFGWYVKQDEEQARLAEISAKTQLTRAATTLAEKELQHGTLKKNYDIQRKIYDSNQKIQELRSVVKELEEAITTQQQAYQGIVESRRNNVRGQVIEHLVLEDGTEYRNAKIMNFDDTYLSILTEQGVMKVKARELPEHLKEFFRLDLIQPEYQLSAAFSSGSPESAASTSSGHFVYTATPSWGAAAGSSDKEKELGENIMAIDKRISLLERAKAAPLAGFDANLRVGSAAHRHRKKVRDRGFDNEIASLKASRRSMEQQRTQLLRAR